MKFFLKPFKKKPDACRHLFGMFNSIFKFLKSRIQGLFRRTLILCIKAETDDLYKKIAEYEAAAKEANSVSDKFDADIRDMSKKVQKLEVMIGKFLKFLSNYIKKDS